eukprot:GHVU01173557.1.p1 GENE.GHVU01173557.1~~GHVU01173557.1.p1  ORF type:complete len:108 (+),score=1.12 GHVU01173557.1:104-427(+)
MRRTRIGRRRPSCVGPDPAPVAAGAACFGGHVSCIASPSSSIRARTNRERLYLIPLARIRAAVVVVYAFTAMCGGRFELRIGCRAMALTHTILSSPFSFFEPSASNV